MLCRLALLALVGAVSACDRTAPTSQYMPPATLEKPPALSAQQVHDLSERCARTSRDQFRRVWNDGIVATADGKKTADFTSHYNAKLNTCFCLLTVTHFIDQPGQGGATASTISKFLFAMNDDELYGEYLGPAAAGSPSANLPKTCRIEALYCASKGEWEVLAEPYMQD